MTLKELRNLITAYKTFAETGNGKLILDDLSNVCYENEDIFSQDPLITAYNAGKRWVILEVRKNINQDLEQIVTRLKELEKLEREKHDSIRL